MNTFQLDSNRTQREARVNDSHATGDAALVARAQTGDRAAIVELYQRYVNEVFGYVVNQLGTVDEAEDVTSEIFLRFVKSIHGFDGRSSIRTWLYVIARNQLRDRWRSERRSPRLVSLDPSLEAPSPARSVASDVDLERDSAAAKPAPATRLGKAILDELPERYRQVLELRIMEGRSVRDTAEEMNTTPGNVKVLQHRALKRALVVADELDLAPNVRLTTVSSPLRSEA